jgi:hypothetical protein
MVEESSVFIVRDNEGVRVANWAVLQHFSQTPDHGIPGSDAAESWRLAVDVRGFIEADRRELPGTNIALEILCIAQMNTDQPALSPLRGRSVENRRRAGGDKLIASPRAARLRGCALLAIGLGTPKDGTW